MSKYSCIEIIKTKAKQMVRSGAAGKHSQALEMIALESKFSNFHELSRVAEVTPPDPRLLKAAFGESNLSEAIYDSEAYAGFQMAVDDELSGHTATTNAYDFTVENLTITETLYDEMKGILELEVWFEYTGEQSTDHAYSGSSFEVEGKVSLLWRNGSWSFMAEDFEITNVVAETEQEGYYED